MSSDPNRPCGWGPKGCGMQCSGCPAPAGMGGPYRTPSPDPCPHEHLLNRGSPPNTSNQRICAHCRRTFDPPSTPGGMVTSNDNGPSVAIQDRS